ncbi:MAG: hypothetical protein IKY46_00495 [Clostridia bacterium]|nr:hypothetical protein [Clostridia bacterium]
MNLLSKNLRKNPLAIIFAVLGILASLLLLVLRVSAENRSDQAACAITYDSVVALAEQSGQSERVWLEQLYDAGIRYLIVTDANEPLCADAARQIGYKIGREGDTPKSGDSFLTPKLGVDAVTAPDAFYTEDTPVAVIENPFRTGVIMPESFDRENTNVPMIKAMYMYNAYSYHYAPQEPATKNENILFGGVFERGLRLVIFTPLYDESKTMVTDIAAYADIISGLSERLSERGITLGDRLSVLDAPAFSPLIFWLSSLLLPVCAVLVLEHILPRAKKFSELLLAAAALVSAVGTFAAPALTQKIWALGTSLVFGCAGALVLAAFARKCAAGESGKLIYSFASLFVCLLVLGTAGGMYIGALLTSRSYMLGFDIFSGVKLSQFAPIAFAVLWLFWALYSPSKRRDLPRGKSLPIPLAIAAGAVLAAAVVVLLLRSGDNMMQVSSLEIRFRNALEYSLYVRPRTKEMLAAFPAIALFAAAAQKRCYILLVPLGAFAAISVSSVINTFCHIFTPVLVSLVRTLSGAAIGALVGMIGMYVLHILLGKEKTNN